MTPDDIRTLARQAEEAGDWSVAARRWAMAANGPDGNAWDAIFAVRALTYGGQTEAAWARLDAITLPSSMDVHRASLRAQILERQGRAEDAIAYWREAASLATDPYWSLFGLARALDQTGRVVEALDTMTEALKSPSAEALGREFAEQLRRRLDASGRRMSSGSTPPAIHPSLILMAEARSGTTAFGETLKARGKLHWFGEIFHHALPAPLADTTYFTWRAGELARHPALLHPTEENQKTLFRRYLRFLGDNTPHPRYVVDVKYTSFHHLNAYWWWPDEQPLLVGIIKELRIPVLHLRRIDVFARFCSLALAVHTGDWHEVTSGRPRTVALDTGDLAPALERMVNRQALYAEYFAGYDLYEELDYETMFEDNRLSKASVDAVELLTGVVVDPDIPSNFRKVTPPLAEVIENWPEVLRAVRGTVFEALVYGHYTGRFQKRPPPLS